MPCYNPLTGWRAKEANESGKRPIVFNPEAGNPEEEIKLPCGRCTGCRLDYSRQWAIRCHHEAQLHEHNSFITLTYNNENLPSDYSIHKEELQKFFKRLRKNTGARFKYYACGEYGEPTEKNNYIARPHYHAVIFGYDFPDKVLEKKTKTGDLLFSSKILDIAWQNKGWALIGNVTFESAAYVARYVMKKRKGDPEEINKNGLPNKHYYQHIDYETGEVWDREPEFCLMSRGSGKQDDPAIWRYGIGREWWNRYNGDLEKDFLTYSGGKKMPVPKYYDYLMEKVDPHEMELRKAERAEKAKELDPNERTIKRLREKEKVKLAQLDQLQRNLDNES
jgi:hypothetical protein